MTAMQSQPNPLSTVANAISARSALLVSLLARIVGAAGALFIAGDQSYDRTQAFCIVIATLAVASLFPLNGTIGMLLAGAGAGLLFFAGAVLFEQGAAIVVLGGGLVAGLAGGAMAYRSGRLPTFLLGFFGGAGVVVGVILAVVLLVAG